MLIFSQPQITEMEGLLRKIYERKRLAAILSVTSHAVSLLSAAALLSLLVYEIYFGMYKTAAILLCAAGVGFAAVSLVRRLINAPRPYELYSFYEKKPKEKSGSSFPSRHAYSAFSIAALFLCVSIPVSIALFALGVLLCVCRVLLGIHFIRDVAAGALIGILSGAVGILLI